MSEKEININFDINAKCQSMIEEANKIIKVYLETTNLYEEDGRYNLAYDVKNYLPKLQQKNQQLKKENTSLRTRIKTIKRIRKKQTQKKNKYKLQIIEIQNLNQQIKQKYLNAVADYESEKSKNQRAINKIDNMFDNGDEYKIIDDLLELDKILKGDNND